MKERIKKFINDHDEAIVVFAGAMIGCVIFGNWAGKQLAGREVDTVTSYYHEDGKVAGVAVHLRNGQTKPFFRPINKSE